MGDGQHIWAAAEWVLMLRNMFVREEGNALVLGGGIPLDWLCAANALQLGPTATLWGTVTVDVNTDGHEVELLWQADWHDSPPTIQVCLPGTEPTTCDPSASNHRVSISAAMRADTKRFATT